MLFSSGQRSGPAPAKKCKRGSGRRLAVEFLPFFHKTLFNFVEVFLNKSARARMRASERTNWDSLAFFIFALQDVRFLGGEQPAHTGRRGPHGVDHTLPSRVMAP